MFKGTKQLFTFHVVPRFKDDKEAQEYVQKTMRGMIFTTTDRETATRYMRENHPNMFERLSLELSH